MSDKVRVEVLLDDGHYLIYEADEVVIVTPVKVRTDYGCIIFTQAEEES